MKLTTKTLYLVPTILLTLPLLGEGFDYASTFNLTDYKGQTYLSFMQDHVKPAMDELATEGYQVCDADQLAAAYELSDKKIQMKVDRNFGGLDNIQEIMAEVVGETVTLNSLPGIIASQDRSVDRYNLATFIGLACGGGVKIFYNEENYGLNVHYDTTEQRSGRSFGVGPTRGANDASDKQYLDDLESYARHSKSNLPKFFEAMFESLLNSDSSGFDDVAPEGQTVLTDFLSVFTAEQARNLMDGDVRPHWDAALMEVTLLSAFHAGQSKIKMYYQNPETKVTTFTDSTYQQVPCKVPSREQAAHLRDYWQFSRNINDPSNCKRSGINITKREFRKLGEKITTYVYDNHPELYDRVQTAMSLNSDSDNLFESLSYYLIGNKSPKKLSAAKVRAITTAWIDFLSFTTEEARNITSEIDSEY